MAIIIYFSNILYCVYLQVQTISPIYIPILREVKTHMTHHPYASRRMGMGFTGMGFTMSNVNVGDDKYLE